LKEFCFSRAIFLRVFVGLSGVFAAGNEDEILGAVALHFLCFALANMPIFSQYFQMVSYANELKLLPFKSASSVEEDVRNVFFLTFSR